jgi:sulfite reductase (NADPH) flavoprotein alpha-component
MSKDVEQALIDIISIHGNLSPDAATGYLNQLSKDGRYSKDVW